jgi:hypothetical protein
VSSSFAVVADLLSSPVGLAVEGAVVESSVESVESSVEGVDSLAESVDDVVLEEDDDAMADEKVEELLGRG